MLWCLVRPGVHLGWAGGEQGLAARLLVFQLSGIGKCSKLSVYAWEGKPPSLSAFPLLASRLSLKFGSKEEAKDKLMRVCGDSPIGA